MDQHTALIVCLVLFGLQQGSGLRLDAVTTGNELLAPIVLETAFGTDTGVQNFITNNRQRRRAVQRLDFENGERPSVHAGGWWTLEVYSDYNGQYEIGYYDALNPLPNGGLFVPGGQPLARAFRWRVHPGGNTPAILGTPVNPNPAGGEVHGAYNTFWAGVAAAAVGGSLLAERDTADGWSCVPYPGEGPAITTDCQKMLSEAKPTDKTELFYEGNAYGYCSALICDTDGNNCHNQDKPMNHGEFWDVVYWMINDAKFTHGGLCQGQGSLNTGVSVAVTSTYRSTSSSSANGSGNPSCGATGTSCQKDSDCCNKCGQGGGSGTPLDIGLHCT